MLAPQLHAGGEISNGKWLVLSLCMVSHLSAPKNASHRRNVCLMQISQSPRLIMYKHRLDKDTLG